MSRSIGPRSVLPAFVALASVVIAACGASGHAASPAATARTQAAVASAPESAALATYSERAPHVLSQLTVQEGVQAGVAGAPSAPRSEMAPVPAAAFMAPIAAYRTFAAGRLGLMQRRIADLEDALEAGDRAAAQTAWRGAFFDYLELGAVYLEGPVAALNEAIDGNPGGLAGGAASPRFSGLHRLERGLWTGAELRSLLPWARRLEVDVGRLRVLVATVAIAPADFATRAHEILEDAVRDLLSGTDVPWSGEGVLGTAAGLAATQEVISTLRGLLTPRESVLSVVDTQLATLRAALASIEAAHGGRVPTDAQLTPHQSEMFESALGGALEALAQVPGALETTSTPATPRIPAGAVRTDP